MAKKSLGLVVFGIVMLASLVVALPGYAAASPANDDRANAEPIPGAPGGSIAWTPTALGRWRARVSFLGTLGFSPSRSGYVSILVAKLIGS